MSMIKPWKQWGQQAVPDSSAPHPSCPEARVPPGPLPCRKDAGFPLTTLAKRYSNGPEAESLSSKARGRGGSTSASVLGTDRARLGLLPLGSVGRWGMEQKELPSELKNEKGEREGVSNASTLVQGGVSTVATV